MPASGRSAESSDSRHVPDRADHLSDFTLRPRALLVTAIAVPIGAVGGLLAYVLLKLIALFTNLFFHAELGFHHAIPDGASWPVILIVPVAGGLAVGLMARYGSEQIRGHGMPEAIESILLKGSKVAPRVAILKPISAALSIGSGGPFGAEGPIIMTGGAAGSVLAQSLRLTADERKALLVAGSAAGMAATFNAPLASILLAVELLLFEWRPRSYLPVAAAVAAATMVRRQLLGAGPLFPVPDVHLNVTTGDYLLCLVAGLLAGVLALVATWLVYFAEDSFRKLPFHWMWWPAIGGLIIGIGGLIQPRALGVGYDVIGELLSGHATTGLIVGILIVKTLIWSLSLGSGTSGGVLAPMFMIGGALGAAEALIFPDAGPGFWALVGLAGVLGGLMRSPLTGVVFCLELTHEWSALLPLVISSAAAYALSSLILKRSVLTEKIARRGFHLTREYSIDPLEVLFVREVMHDDEDIVALDADDPVRVVTAASFGTAAERMSGTQRLYPALEGDRFLGVVTRRKLLELAIEGAPAAMLVRDIMVDRVVVAHPDDTLREVAYQMAEHRVSRVPVVERDNPSALVGMVTLQQLLEGRLRDLQEERHVERVLWTRRPIESPRESVETAA